MKSFKYLGTLLDESLSFCDHVDFVYKKAQQRLFLLRKQKSFDVSQHIFQLVYRGLIESILSFNIITWYGNVSAKNKIKLARVVNTASKLIGNEHKHLSRIYNAALKRKARQIVYDPTPLSTYSFITLDLVELDTQTWYQFRLKLLTFQTRLTHLFYVLM